MFARSGLLVIVLVAGCGGGGQAMMKLEDKVFDLVPQEDRARLDPSRKEVELANARWTEAKGAVSSLNDARASAEREQKAADLQLQASRAKRTWVIARQDYLKKAEVAAAKEVLANEAKHQLERAKLAEAKGLRPFGGEAFNASKFLSQSQAHDKAYMEAKQAADAAKAKASEAETKFKALQQKAEEAR